MLGKNTKIGAKAELVRCVTQAGYEVDPGGLSIQYAYTFWRSCTSATESVKNEKLEISDWAAGGVSESEDEDD